ncbi:MAG TPA: peptidoglycan-binding domain-containing protein [Mycobacteriales bacterium]|nr:peptidoglycan-binding domain-containing protein [Mycobacteriales bacterium]
MPAIRKAALLAAAALAVPLGLIPAGPASAAPQCTIDLVWQNAFTPGEDSGSFSPNCQMGRGAHSNAVGELQSALNTCHHKNIAVDNDFGPATQSALISVQRALGISADGVYGPQTARAMSHVIVSGGGACKRITF